MCRLQRGNSDGKKLLLIKWIHGLGTPDDLKILFIIWKISKLIKKKKNKVL